MSLSDQLWCPTSVQVTVLQARGLRIKGKSGTNDAYAVMQVGKEKYQTSVMEKSVAPVWKEEAAFDLPQLQQAGGGGGGGTERSTLHVHVLHRALVGPDKLLGQAVINLLQLSEDKTRNKTEWFKLLDKTGKSDKDRGEVLVDIQFMRNNMTASMFDLSAAGKSRSRLGKLKDKVRGKKKESDTVSSVVPSLTQVLTDSEEEGHGDGEVAAGKDEKKKKHKMKSLFSPKSNLQRNMSQSMTVLPAKNSTLSGSQSSGLNVDSSEGKKKFKFKIHKRSGSSDGKDSSAGHQKHSAAEQSNLCINGSHIYCEEPPPRTSRIGSNYSLASSGHGSMEDVPDSSPPSVDSLRTVRQYSPWTEEEEEEEAAEKENIIKEDEGELRREEEERIRMEEERRRKEEEEERVRMEEEKRRKEERVRREEEELERLAEEKRRLEEERRRIEEEKRQREEGERIRLEEERAQEERRRQEEEERKLAEEKRRLEEERRIEEERVRKEEEERIRREEEERRREEEEERKLAEEKRRLKEERRIEEERVRKEEEERKRREEEERRRQEEEECKLAEEKRRLEEERRIEEERVRKEEEERKRREEEERRRQEEEERARKEEEEERERLAEEKRRREEEEERRRIEVEEERKRKEEERIRLEEEKAEEERRRREEEESARREEEERKSAEEKMRLEEEERKRTEEEKVRKEEEERIRREEERRRQEEEEMVRRQEGEREERRRRDEEARSRKEEEEEEKARKEKEEYERLLAEKRKQEEEERKRIEEEEKIRKEEEERVRQEEARRRKEEEERLQLAEKRRLEEQERRRIEEEEKRQREEEEEERIRKEEEERVRKEKEEYERLALERRRIEEERIRREEEERIRMEEERRRREEEQKRIIEEEEKMKREEEERIKREKKAEEEARKLEKVTRDAEELKKKENITKHKAAGTKSKVEKPAEVTSTNPFDEDFSNNPFEESPTSAAAPDSSTTKVSQQRNQSAAASTDEKDLGRIQREKRQAPRPPGRNQAERQSQGEQDGSARHVAQINKQSKDKDIKTVSVPPQRSVQMIAPLNRSPADAKNAQSLTQSSNTKGTASVAKHSKRPAPSRPDGKISNERGSEAKQQPTVYGLNPFEDDEDDNELAAQDDTTNTGPVQWPPAADKTAASQAKIKSSKTARAPLLPAKTDATPSTLINQNTEGSHVTDDTGVTHPSDPEHVQETPLQESQPATVQSAGEESGGKKEGPPTASRRLQPVKPLNPAGQQQSVSVVQVETDDKSTTIHSDVQKTTKADDTGLKGPYSQLTREELISLVRKQEKQLSERDKKISELELYIDNLLVRVMEEKPSILMSLNSLK